MGFLKSIKKVVKQAVPIATAAAGAYLGGPTGAAAGYNIGNGVTGQTGQGLFGNILNGAVGLGQDYIQSQYNMAMQKDLASYNTQQQMLLNTDAFQKNLEMWNLKNQYDSPAEQMKRYEEAGLNKNLIYGQSNVSGSAPTFEAPTFNTGEYKPVDTRIQRAQLALALEAQHQQIVNQAIENEFAREKIALAAREADRSDALAKAQIAAVGHNMNLVDARLDDLTFKHNQPQSWIGRNWNDIKGIANEAKSTFMDWYKNRRKSSVHGFNPYTGTYF